VLPLFHSQDELLFEHLQNTCQGVAAAVDALKRILDSERQLLSLMQPLSLSGAPVLPRMKVMVSPAK
jgi:hypothetical protein